MKFQNSESASGQKERFASGEPTERLLLISETREESEANRAALANLALNAFQLVMDSEDARFLLDYMRLDQVQQERLTVYPEQAERLAELLRQGSSSVMPEILKNQFNSNQNAGAEHVDDERLTRVAVDAANAITVEVKAREFTKEIDSLFGTHDEV
ncbi:MAG: hypothetical protein JWO54_971 [Candidatus Saccharibacteria bacterium]|nr:hypothetical protein [Candidatus Saccharibacteria bacterium]MDB5181208.1 hypothetical protein [Candidatus Saccharibacteria bacterium]